MQCVWVNHVCLIIILILQWLNECLDIQIEKFNFDWGASCNQPQHSLISAITDKNIVIMRKIKGETYAQNIDIQLKKKIKSIQRLNMLLLLLLLLLLLPSLL